MLRIAMFLEEKVIFGNSALNIKNRRKQLGIWLPYNSSLSRSMQPRQTYSPVLTNGKTDRKLGQAINPSAVLLRSGLKIQKAAPRLTFNDYNAYYNHL